VQQREFMLLRQIGKRLEQLPLTYGFFFKDAE
jgi:hypothetical protein